MKKSFFLLQLLVFLMVGLAAFAQTVTGVVMSEDGPLPGANYNVGEYTQAWTDQTTARRAVRYATRLETAMEGNRFLDLQRWGVQRDVLNDYLARESKYRAYLQGKQFLSTKNEFYPIPTYAIERSFKDGEPTLTQDPNY